MNKRMTLILSGLVVLASALPAFAWVGTEDLGTYDPLDILAPFNQTGVRTLSADTLYTVYGLYYVEAGATLNIPAGTVIQGVPGATFVIKPGATINATGTEQSPIIMTSSQPAGSRNPGDWGGVVILGNAPVNKDNPLIEGGIIDGTYGGSDPDDSSGVFKYVRIEFPGYRFQLNNEVNGLTMGGVGRGTEIHHIQVSYSFDDSYEWFGGTVNAKYLVAFGGTDDVFDTDFGYQGRVQFALDCRDPYIWDAAGTSNGFECDNDGTGSLTEPRTWPVFSNVTMCGPQAFLPDLVVGHKFGSSALIRLSARTSIFNSVIMGYPYGMEIVNSETQDDAWTDTLRVRNLSLAGSLEKTPGSIHRTDKWADVTTWFDRMTPGYSIDYDNLGTAPRTAADLNLLGGYPLNLNAPNPVPGPGSELIGSADFSDSYLSESFFDVVSYRGAFDPAAKSMDAQWTAGWTNFDPQTSDYGALSPVALVPSIQAGLDNYPNPFNPSTTLKFSVPRTGHVTLSVFDVRGRIVANLHDGELEKGVYTRRFDGEGLPSGTYFYRLSGQGFEVTQKMQLVK